MIELAIAKADADRLSRELLGGHTERCAVLFASPALGVGGNLRLIVRAMQFPTPESYSEQTKISAELNPALVAHVSKTARIRGDSLVFVHSHPAAASAVFSAVDDLGEQRLAAFLAVRTPGVSHAALLLSAGGWAARQLGSIDPIRVTTLGRQREVLYSLNSSNRPVLERFDRQVRAFGAAGQQVIGSLRIAIVGLGGTGSVAAQQLAHLGVRDFLLIDPDRVERTNLNRVVGATESDVGRSKVEVAADQIAAISPNAAVETICGDITRTPVARALTAADFLFSCTDSHGSRAVIQQITYQYFIPCIDVGSVLTAAAGHVTGIHGRVQAISPGLPCFTCSALIDSEQVRRDLLSESERRLDPYIQGAQEPAPSVISLNSTVTSLAVTMFMAMTVGIPSEGRYVLYNARGPSLRSVTANQNPACYICSPRGVLGRGDQQALFTRDE